MMYDDLIKQLRYCADATTCRNCLWKTECCPTDMQKKAADAIEELRKAVLRLEDESGIYDELPMFYIYPTKWIPVTERLPEKGIDVLVFAEGKIEGFFGDTVIAISNRYDFKIFTDFEEVEVWRSPWQYFLTDYEITHWMPLPEPPKDGG